MEPRNFSAGASASPPTPLASPSVGYPTAGNPGTGTPATKPGAHWYYQIAEELRNLILAAGLTPDHAVVNQLLTALRSAGVFTTPAQFDNSTRVATTEHVQRALGNWRAIANPGAGTTTLTAADVGAAYSLNDGSNIALPLFSTVANGSSFLFLNASQTTSRTISRQGSDLLFGLDTSGAHSAALISITLAPGEWVIMSASAQWEVMAGFHWLKSQGGLFASSLAGNGYQKLPSGLIIQWNTVMSNVTAFNATSFSFPITFPSNVVAILLTPVSSAVTTLEAHYSAKTTSGFNLLCSQVSTSINYLAIGY